MTRTLAALAALSLAVSASVASAQEIERLEPDLAHRVGKLIAEAVAKQPELPFEMKLNGDLTTGLKGGERGALIIPAADLTAEKIAKVGKDEVLPVGLLVFRGATVVPVDDPIAADKLRTVGIKVDDNPVTLAAFPLGVARVADRPVLVLYGQGKKPVAVTTLEETPDKTGPVAELSLVKAGDRRGLLQVSFFGKAHAALHIAAVE
jgi:hypothetical protein